MEKQALSPLVIALTGATLGGALGAGVSAWKDDKDSKKPLIGALIGALPGLATAVQQYARTYDDISLKDPNGVGILDPLLLDAEALGRKSSIYRDRLDNLISPHYE